jgi:hypothetical protein
MRRRGRPKGGGGVVDDGTVGDVERQAHELAEVLSASSVSGSMAVPMTRSPAARAASRDFLRQAIAFAVCTHRLSIDYSRSNRSPGEKADKGVEMGPHASG